MPPADARCVPGRNSPEKQGHSRGKAEDLGASAHLLHGCSRPGNRFIDPPFGVGLSAEDLEWRAFTDVLED